MKTLADEDSRDSKIIVVGINKAGHNLIGFAHDLVNRIDVVRIRHTNPILKAMVRSPRADPSVPRRPQHGRNAVASGVTPPGRSSGGGRSDEQQRSGLTVRDFCQREGLKDWTFRWWRQELARRDRRALGRDPGLSRRASRPKRLPAFLPVRVVDLEAISPRPAPPIEIVLPDRPDRAGPLRFRSRAPSVEVLAVLEGRPC